MWRANFLVLTILSFPFTFATPTCAADLEKYLPKETDVVVSCNVRQALDSSIVKDHALALIKTTLTGSKDAQEVIKTLGLDPLTDFQRVSIGLNLDNVQSPSMLTIIEGKFDLRKIQEGIDEFIKQDPKKFGKEQVAGNTVYRIAAMGRAAMYTSLVDSSIVVISSSKEPAAAAFDAFKGTRKPEIRKELADLLAKADSTSSLFMVAHTKGRLANLPFLDNEMKRLLDQIHTMTVAVRVERDVTLDLAIGAGTLDEAKKMHTLVAGGLEFGKLQVKVAVTQQPELQAIADLVNSMTAAQKDKTVVISGKVGGDAIGKLIKSGK
ncbi:MAG: hypothetical protein K8T89_05620 [Planctomycetes bacterium]|nr:hypothetical protein [Planctomycetota bacterium]